MRLITVRDCKSFHDYVSMISKARFEFVVLCRRTNDDNMIPSLKGFNRWLLESYGFVFDFSPDQGINHIEITNEEKFLFFTLKFGGKNDS